MFALWMFVAASLIAMGASYGEDPQVLGPEYSLVDWAKCNPEITACYKAGLSYDEVVASDCWLKASALPECQLKNPIPMTPYPGMYGNGEDENEHTEA